LKIVVRKNSVRFLVLLSEAARNSLGFFESVPTGTVALSRYDMLGDYKPIIKRTGNACFRFVLHHHVVPPLLHDGEYQIVLNECVKYSWEVFLGPLLGENVNIMHGICFLHAKNRLLFPLIL
jgi:hypothetical protein